MRLIPDLRSPQTLFCCAHPSEAKALPSGQSCLVTGVGKVPAAVALSQYLKDQPKGSVVGVFVFGVAGVYPGPDAEFDPGLGVGQSLWVTQDQLVDEGVQTPEGFLDLDSLDLRGDSPRNYGADARWVEALMRQLALPNVAGATVSTCSGTDALALSRARRSAASVETMEGAALAHCCWQANLPWVQLRVISNRCADRSKAGWNLPLALTSLQESLTHLLEA